MYKRQVQEIFRKFLNCSSWYGEANGEVFITFVVLIFTTEGVRRSTVGEMDSEGPWERASDRRNEKTTATTTKEMRYLSNFIKFYTPELTILETV